MKKEAIGNNIHKKGTLGKAVVWMGTSATLIAGGIGFGCEKPKPIAAPTPIAAQQPQRLEQTIKIVLITPEPKPTSRPTPEPTPKIRKQEIPIRTVTPEPTQSPRTEVINPGQDFTQRSLNPGEQLSLRSNTIVAGDVQITGPYGEVLAQYDSDGATGQITFVQRDGTRVVAPFGATIFELTNQGLANNAAPRIISQEQDKMRRQGMRPDVFTVSPTTIPIQAPNVSSPNNAYSNVITPRYPYNVYPYNRYPYNATFTTITPMPEVVNYNEILSTESMSAGETRYLGRHNLIMNDIEIVNENTLKAIWSSADNDPRTGTIVLLNPIGVELVRTPWGAPLLHLNPNLSEADVRRIIKAKSQEMLQYGGGATTLERIDAVSYP